jgi:hypothetical protein
LPASSSSSNDFEIGSRNLTPVRLSLGRLTDDKR